MEDNQLRESQLCCLKCPIYFKFWFVSTANSSTTDFVIICLIDNGTDIAFLSPPLRA